MRRSHLPILLREDAQLIFTQYEKCADTEFFWFVFSRIQSEYGRIRTRNNSLFGHFSLIVTCSKSTIETLEKGVKFVQANKNKKNPERSQ